MAVHDLLSIIRDKTTPELTEAQVPEIAELEAVADLINTACDGMRLVTLEDAEAAQGGASTVEDETMNALVSALLTRVPELAEYLQLDPALFADVMAMDKSLHRGEGVLSNLREVTAQTTLLVAAKATELTDQVLGSAETLLNDSSTPLAISARINERLFPIGDNIEAVALQLQGRRHRDARRASLIGQDLHLPQAQLEVKTHVATLAAPLKEIIQ